MRLVKVTPLHVTLARQIRERQQIDAEQREGLASKSRRLTRRECLGRRGLDYRHDMHRPRPERRP